jgi:hypothetical protein
LSDRDGIEAGIPFQDIHPFEDADPDIADEERDVTIGRAEDPRRRDPRIPRDLLDLRFLPRLGLGFRFERFLDRQRAVRRVQPPHLPQLAASDRTSQGGPVAQPVPVRDERRRRGLEHGAA